MSEVVSERLVISDYIELCKPKVVLLMLLCVMVGVCLASPSGVPLDVLLFCTLGVGLVASSAAVINHLADSHIDAKMARTQNRPVATGRVGQREGLIFAAILGVAGMLVLWFLTNPLTAWLNLCSWVGYGLVYTFFLKRATSQNIVIGGLFGAAPPLFGWTAVTNSIEPGGLLLVLIIFVWTPPHFWALAIDRKEEYAEVGVPMLPVTHGSAFTRLFIFNYTILLVGVTILPYQTGMSGLIYLITAIFSGIVFLWYANKLKTEENIELSMRVFQFSIHYLMVLFAALLVDHYLLFRISDLI